MTNYRRVEKARANLRRAEEALRDERRRRTILCSCGKRHAIGKLALVITHWYHEPHGCNEGDYWSEGEWRFVCPITSVENRLLFDDYDVEYADRQKAGVAAEPTFKSLYLALFASVERRHQHHEKCGDNNSYIDQHRERFELPAKRM